MKVADVISRVRNIAGDLEALQFTDQQIIDWINDGVRECSVQNNLLQKSGTVTVTQGTDSYSVPSDVLKLHSVKYDGMKLRVMTLQEHEELTAGLGADAPPEDGTPQHCYIWAGNIVLNVPPDNSTSVLKIEYLYEPDAHALENKDTDDVALPVGYHSRIVDYCLAQVAQQDDDMNRYAVKMQEFQTGVTNLKDQPESTYDLYPSISVAASDMGPYYDSGEY